MFCIRMLTTCMLTHRFLMLFHQQIFHNVLPILRVSCFSFAAALYCCSASLATQRPSSLASCLCCSCSSRLSCQHGGSRQMMRSQQWSGTKQLPHVSRGRLPPRPLFTSPLIPLLPCRGLFAVGWPENSLSVLSPWWSHPPPPMGRGLLSESLVSTGISDEGGGGTM